MQAVRDGNADRLGDLTTDDVVAVLKDGQCMNGKQAVIATLRHIFSLYDVERKALASGMIMRDKLGNRARRNGQHHNFSE